MGKTKIEAAPKATAATLVAAYGKEYDPRLVAAHRAMRQRVAACRAMPLALFAELYAPHLAGGAGAAAVAAAAPNVFSRFAVHLNPRSSAGTLVCVNAQRGDWCEALCRQLGVDGLAYRRTPITEFSLAELATLQPIRPTSRYTPSPSVGAAAAAAPAAPCAPLAVPEACQPGVYERAQRRADALTARIAAQVAARVEHAESWDEVKRFARDRAAVGALVGAAAAPHTLPPALLAAAATEIARGIGRAKALIVTQKALRTRTRAFGPTFVPRVIAAGRGAAADELSDEEAEAAPDAPAELSVAERQVLAEARQTVEAGLVRHLSDAPAWRRPLNTWATDADTRPAAAPPRGDDDDEGSVPALGATEAPAMPALIYDDDGAAAATYDGDGAISASATMPPMLTDEDDGGGDWDAAMPALSAIDAGVGRFAWSGGDDDGGDSDYDVAGDVPTLGAAVPQYYEENPDDDYDVGGDMPTLGAAVPQYYEENPDDDGAPVPARGARPAAAAAPRRYYGENPDDGSAPVPAWGARPAAAAPRYYGENPDDDGAPAWGARPAAAPRRYYGENPDDDSAPAPAWGARSAATAAPRRYYGENPDADDGANVPALGARPAPAAPYYGDEEAGPAGSAQPRYEGGDDDDEDVGAPALGVGARRSAEEKAERKRHKKAKKEAKRRTKEARKRAKEAARGDFVPAVDDVAGRVGAPALDVGARRSAEEKAERKRHKKAKKEAKRRTKEAKEAKKRARETARGAFDPAVDDVADRVGAPAAAAVADDPLLFVRCKPSFDLFRFVVEQYPEHALVQRMRRGEAVAVALDSQHIFKRHDFLALKNCGNADAIGARFPANVIAPPAGARTCVHADFGPHCCFFARRDA